MMAAQSSSCPSVVRTRMRSGLSPRSSDDRPPLNPSPPPRPAFSSLVATWFSYGAAVVDASSIWKANVGEASLTGRLGTKLGCQTHGLAVVLGTLKVACSSLEGSTLANAFTLGAPSSLPAETPMGDTSTVTGLLTRIRATASPLSAAEAELPPSGCHRNGCALIFGTWKVAGLWLIASSSRLTGSCIDDQVVPPPPVSKTTSLVTFVKVTPPRSCVSVVIVCVAFAPAGVTTCCRENEAVDAGAGSAAYG